MNSMDARIQAVAESTRGKQFDEIQSESVYLMGVADKALSDRIEAFGAIRRAAELVRQADHNARVARFGGYELDAHASEAIAECLRFAIRAAIGSDKT